MSLEDQGAVETPEPSLRDSLSAAFDAFETDTPQSAPAERAPEAQSAPPADTRPRDDTGRFVAKPAEAAQATRQPEPKTPQASAAAVETPPSAPPATWSATAKAKFAALDPDVQREVLKREGEMDQGRAQWQQGAERLNRLDAILAPRRQQFTLAGLDDARAIEVLFAAQDFLQRDPVNALIYLGRQSGVDWSRLVQSLQGGAAGPARAQVPPGLEPLFSQVQTLTQTVQQQQQAAADAQRSGHLQQIQSFAADPKNLYFENVRERMGRLLRAQEATSLEDAYEKACQLDPQVAPLLSQQRESERQASVKAEAQARAQAARQASGSVTGSPAPGASPSGGPAPTLRDELLRAWDSAA